MKKCRRCKIEKKLNQFDPDRLGKFGVASTCKTCKKEKTIENYKPIKNLTTVKKVGKKTLNRIKEKGSEARMYVEVRQTRSHYCQNCGGEIKFFDPSCFAHILSKGLYPQDEFRYNPLNIALVHSILQIKNESTGETYTCHQEIDKKMAGKKLEFETLLAKGDPEEILEFIKHL